MVNIHYMLSLITHRAGEDRISQELMPPGADTKASGDTRAGGQQKPDLSID